MILEITGAGRKLNTFIEELAPNINQLKSKVYPAVQKMEDMEKRLDILKRTFSGEQSDRLLNNGYTFMDYDQAKFIHGNKYHTKDFPRTHEEHERKLENDIRKLAKFEDRIRTNSVPRFRRQTDSDDRDGDRNGDGDGNIGSTEGGGEYEFQDWNVLRPWAFVNRMNETVVWEATILSPHAFSTEYLTAELLTVRLFVFQEL